MEKPYIIGISGGSGSGKTTFINELKARLSTDDVCFLSLDDYYRPREEQWIDEEGVKNFDLPSSIDEKSFVEDVQALLNGKEITRKEYVFNNALATPKDLVFCPAPILILEGIFVFHFEEIRKMLDLKVFLHAKENLKLIRRIKRDREERNNPLEDVLYRYQHHVLPTFEQYIKPYQEEADIVVNNNEHFKNALDVVSGFIRFKLQTEA